MQQIIQSILTLPNTIILAVLTWLVKSSYRSYTQEKLGIAILERTYVLNLRILDDNVDFIKQWLGALKNNTYYSCHFEDMIIDNTSHLQIGNLKLVNVVVKANYIQQRTSSDLKNTYREYKELYSYFRDKKISAEELISLTENTNAALEEMMKGMVTFVRPTLIEAVAHLQLAGRAKERSIYGYLNYLNKTIFPRVTTAKIEERVKEMNAEFEQKSKQAEINPNK